MEFYSVLVCSADSRVYRLGMGISRRSGGDLPVGQREGQVAESLNRVTQLSKGK